MKNRVSLVHYLNAAPLGWSFLYGPLKDYVEVLPSSPANCADQLARGEVDIGVIPSVEYQRIPNLQIISGISIASLEKVRSLLLIKPKGKEKIRSVALDASSRTTVALAKILLAETMGLHPEYRSFPPDIHAMLAGCDAALLIGDPALQISLDDYDAIDLVEAWVRWQRKPFVCAFWACRKDAALAHDLPAVFREARDWGVRHFQEIAAVYAKSLNLPVSFLENYLTSNIDYNLEPKHLAGLQEFYNQAHRLGLIAELKPIDLL